MGSFHIVTQDDHKGDHYRFNPSGSLEEDPDVECPSRSLEKDPDVDYPSGSLEEDPDVTF